jgi:hypothetical protein
MSRSNGGADQPEAAAAGRILFRIPFRSAMRGQDADRLRSAGLTLNLHPKHPTVVPPLGLASLGLDSGLYLVRGQDEHEWVLEGRTWGTPAPEMVRRWQLEAIFAAKRLDPHA